MFFVDTHKTCADFFLPEVIWLEDSKKIPSDIFAKIERQYQTATDYHSNVLLQNVIIA